MSYSIYRNTRAAHTSRSAQLKPSRKPRLMRGGFIGLALLPLSACGDGGAAPTNSTTPPPAPDFTESPANTFTARDDNDRTLDQTSATADLTVTGKGGNDTITTGSGADVIDGGAGNDVISSGAGADKIRGGEGLDTITAGDGNDVIVVIGATTANQYTDASITNPAGSGADLSSLISLADLNNRTVSEVVSGETIDGGTGNNTLYIYGEVDLTGVMLTNVNTLIVNSDVTLTAEQIAQFTTIDGDGNSVINIVVPDGSGDAVLDLSAIDISDVGAINIEGDITIQVQGIEDLAGIENIAALDSGKINLAVLSSDTPQTIDISDLLQVFDLLSSIEISEGAAFKISTIEQFTSLGLSSITGNGLIDTNGSLELLAELQEFGLSEEITVLPFKSFSLSAHEYVRGDGGLTLDFDLGDREATITVRLSARAGSENYLIESFTGRQGEFILPEFHREFYDTAFVETIDIDSITIEEKDGTVIFLNQKVLSHYGIQGPITVKNSPKDDTTPPILQSFSIDENDVDAMGRPKFVYNASDDQSGVGFIYFTVEDEYGYSHNFNSSDGETTSYRPNIAPNPSISGLSPWLSGTFTITSIMVIDDSAANGNRQTYSTEELDALGFQTTFEITAPRNNGALVDPLKFNSLEIESFDIDLSDVTGTQLTLNIDGVLRKHGFSIYNTETSQTIWTEGFGSSFDFESIQDISAGSWKITSIYLTDVLGRAITLDQDDLADIGFDKEIIVTGEKSAAQPGVLESFIINDEVIDLDNGDFYISGEMRFKDGVEPEDPYVRYMSETGEYISISFQHGAGIEILSPYVKAGVYNFVDLRMNANEIIFTEQDLSHIDIPLTLTIINSLEDFTGPELTSIEIIDDMINMDEGEKTLSFNYALDDDVSGIESVLISLRGPNQEKYYISGNAEEEGVSFRLPDDAPSGIYTIFQVRISDVAGNRSSYLNKDLDYSEYSNLNNPAGYLRDFGIEPSFTVQNDNPPIDQISPDFTLLDFNSKDQIVDLTEGDGGFNFEISAGVSTGLVNGILVKYIDPAGGLHSEYINGAQGSVSLKLDLSHSPAGEYNLFEISVFDHEGNKQTYDKAAIEAEFGTSSTTFDVINPALPEIELGENTIQTYLPIKAITPTGDILKDALLNNIQYTLPGDGSPLIITYSFANSEKSIYDQTTGYYSEPNVDFEESRFFTQLDGNEQSLVRDIFDDIENFANIIFVEIDDNGAHSAGHMRFAWTSGERDPSSFWTDTAAAWSFSPTGNTQAGDIWLSDQSFRDKAQGDETHLILKQTLMHEIGHALGLKHPHEIEGNFGVLPDGYDGKDYTLMSYNDFSHYNGYGAWYGGPQSYMSLDITALQYIYGVNDSTSAGDDVYYVNDANLSLFTLWDVGGNDTLNTSSLYNQFGENAISQNVAVNLTPGTWSNLQVYYQEYVDYSKTTDNRDQIFITNDTIIENLITGDGNDVLIGNNADNILQSNDGNDFLSGGQGIDTLAGGKGDDTLVYSSGDNYDGGEGSDTLILEESGLTLDLSQISMINMEAVDITGSGNNSLSLTLQDILDTADTTNQIMIKGDAGDSVSSISQNWVLGADQTIDGEIYHTYTSGDATLLIDADITQDIT